MCFPRQNTPLFIHSIKIKHNFISMVKTSKLFAQLLWRFCTNFQQIKTTGSALASSVPQTSTVTPHFITILDEWRDVALQHQYRHSFGVFCSYFLPRCYPFWWQKLESNSLQLVSHHSSDDDDQMVMEVFAEVLRHDVCFCRYFSVYAFPVFQSLHISVFV